MSSYKVSMNVANSNGYIFTGTKPGDLVIKSDSSNAAVFFGSQSNIHGFMKNNSGYLKSTFVGIAGQSNPQYPLDVLGDLNVSGNILKNGDLLQMSQWNDINNDLYILSSNVGIGTSNPSYQLEVKGGIANFKNAIYINGAPITIIDPTLSNIVYSTSNRAYIGAVNKSGSTISGTLVSSSVNVTDSLLLNGIHTSNIFAPLSISNVVTFSSNTEFANNSYYHTTSNIAYASSNKAFNNLPLIGGSLTGPLVGTTISANILKQSNVDINDLFTNIQTSNIAYNALPNTGGSINGSLIITGDLTTLGSTTNIDVPSLSFQDNILTLNKNQIGNPASILKSGIEVERGTESNYQFVFDEGTNLFKVGTEGQLQAVTTRIDDLASGYPYYDQITAKLTTRAIGTADVSNLNTTLTSYSNTIYSASNIEYNGSIDISTDSTNSTTINNTNWSFIFRSPTASNFFLRSSMGSVDTGKQKHISNIGISNVTVNVTSSNGLSILTTYTLSATSNLHLGWYENAWYRLA